MTTFLRTASALAKRYPATGGQIIVISLSDQVMATERAIRPQAVALAVFAVLAGLIGLAVIGQLLARQLVLDSVEFPILRALGMTRASLAGLSLARLAAVTLAGAVVAVGVAIAASPLMPIGPARLAEPTPGVEVNLAVLGIGFAIIVVLPLAVLVPQAWRAAGRAQGPLGVAEPVGPARPSRLGSALGLAGSVPGSIGVRMAFEPGRGRTAVPVRSALAGHDRGGGRGDDRGGVRHEPDRPCRYPAPVRAELEPGVRPGIRGDPGDARRHAPLPRPGGYPVRGG